MSARRSQRDRASGAISWETLSSSSSGKSMTSTRASSEKSTASSERGTRATTLPEATSTPSRAMGTSIPRSGSRGLDETAGQLQDLQRVRIEKDIHAYSQLISKELDKLRDPEQRRQKFLRMLKNLRDVEFDPIVLKEMRRRIRAMVREQIVELGTTQVDIEAMGSEESQQSGKSGSKRRAGPSEDELLGQQMGVLSIGGGEQKAGKVPRGSPPGRR